MDSQRPTISRRDRNRSNMVSRLCGTAFQLFEVHGYDNVTMEQIAGEADVAKATLYKHFPVKEALIAHRFQEEISQGMSALSADLAKHKSFAARMRQLLRASATWHAGKKNYLPHYLRFMNSVATYGTAGSNIRQYDSGSKSILAELFRNALESREIASNLSPERLAWAFEYLLLSAIVAWLCQPDTDLTDGFLSVFDLFLHGTQPEQTSTQTARTTNNSGQRTTSRKKPLPNDKKRNTARKPR